VRGGGPDLREDRRTDRTRVVNFDNPDAVAYSGRGNGFQCSLVDDQIVQAVDAKAMGGKEWKDPRHESKGTKDKTAFE
jgi:hypothetical protein